MDPFSCLDLQHAAFDAIESKASDIKNETKHNDNAIHTHIQDFDAITQGLQRGTLMILGGSTGMGKSAFSLGLAHRISTQDSIPVLYGTFASRPIDSYYKLLAFLSGINLQQLRAHRMWDHEWHLFGETSRVLSDSLIFFFGENCSSLKEIGSYCVAVKQQTSIAPGVLFLDYLQLLPFLPSWHDKDIENVLRRLKVFAVQYDLCIVLLCQSAPNSELRNSRKPYLNDLPAVVAMQAFADIIAVMHRDEFWHNELSTGTRKPELVFYKNMDNPLGSISLADDLFVRPTRV